MCRLSAFAAVSLADLVELSVGHSREGLNLTCFSDLLVGLTQASTKSGELGEVARALQGVEAQIGGIKIGIAS